MQKLPEWFRKEVPNNPTYKKVNNLLKDLSINTVCKAARCPNVGECYSSGTATFMVLGNTCTRNCKFCAIDLGKPAPVDQEEPDRIREAVEHLQLSHVVVTMVSRDDLPDQGAGHIRRVITEVKKVPNVTIEVLISDLGGVHQNLITVLEAEPDVLNHNLETTEALHPEIRPMMSYRKSLEVLKRTKEFNPRIKSKSGIMLGVGELKEDIHRLFRDLVEIRCDALTIGQYLQPPGSPLEVKEYIKPEEFKEYRRVALDMGIPFVVSSPLTRSSYKAAQIFKEFKNSEEEE